MGSSSSCLAAALCQTILTASLRTVRRDRQDHRHLPRRRRARRHPPRRDQQLDRQGAGRAALPARPAQQEALEEYRSVTGVKDDLDSAAFKRRLHLQGLLVDVDGRWKPSGLGVILFGEEPRTTIREAGLLATIHLAGGGEETEDFDGPQVLVPDRAMTWLGDRLPDAIDRSHAQRRRVRESSFELVREGLVNALVHRDYGIRGAKCQLVVDGDMITITSPGGPPE